MCLFSNTILGQKQINLSDYYYCAKGFLPGRTVILIDCTKDTMKVEYYNNYYTDAYVLKSSEILYKYNVNDTLYKGINSQIFVRRNNVYLNSKFENIGRKKMKLMNFEESNRIRNLAYIEDKLLQEKSKGYNISRNDLFEIELVRLNCNEFKRIVELKCIDLRQVDTKNE